MPAQQSIWRNDRDQFEQRLTFHCLGFSRQRCPLRVGAPDRFSAQPVFDQPVLGQKEFDDGQLIAKNPTSRDHQQKGEQRWHGTHAASLSHAAAELLDSTRWSSTLMDHICDHLLQRQSAAASRCFLESPHAPRDHSPADDARYRLAQSDGAWFDAFSPHRRLELSTQ